MSPTNTTRIDARKHEPAARTRLKKIRPYGAGLAVTLTKGETKALHLHQGEYVKVTLTRPTKEEIDAQIQREEMTREQQRNPY